MGFSIFQMLKCLSKSFAVLVMGSSLVAFPSLSSAQTIPQGVQDQQRQIQLDQRQRERQQQLERELERNQPPPQVPVVPVTPEPEGSTSCIDIRDVVIRGVTQIDQDVIDALANPIRGVCVPLAAIDQVLRDITNAYVAQGFATSRAVIAPDEFSNGILVIVVVEGLIQSFEPAEASGLSAQELSLAFPSTVGDIFNVRDMEQGLDQLNRLASNQATVDLLPGSSFGGTGVVIKNEPSFPLHFSGTRSSDGDDSTGGMWRQAYTVQADSLLGLNDLVTVGFSQNEQERNAVGRSESYNGSLNIPYGYWTVSYGQSYSTYQSEFQSGITTFNSDGHTRSQTGTLDYVFHRGADSKSSISLLINRYDSTNTIDETRLSASTYTLGTAELKVFHSRRLWDGVLSVSLGHEQGLRMLGATRDDPQNGVTFPKAQFELTEATLDYARAFPLFDQVSLQYSISALGQYAPQALYSARQLVLGGAFSVRGYEDQSVSGNTGVRVRQEVAVPVPVHVPALLDRVVGTPQIYGFYDHGYVAKGEGGVYNGGVLSGYGLGLRMTAENVSLNMSYARPHMAPSRFDKRQESAYLSLTVKF